MPKCSIVIPWYLNVDDLDRAIASIMAQSVQDFEIIIVVNGVPEAVCDDIRARYTDERIRILYSEKPHASLARNIGLKHANGELIFLLDADDVFYPDKLEIFLQTHAAEPFDLAFSRGVRERGSDISWSFPIGHWDGRQPISEFFFCDGCTISSTALVLAHSAVGQIYFSEHYMPYEDPSIVMDAVHLGLRVRMLADELYEWNDARVGDRLSQKPNFQERLDWVKFMADKMTHKGALAFKARCVAQHMFPMKAGACVSMIFGALRGGAISPKEAALFLVRGLIPSGLRRRLVSLYFLRRQAQVRGTEMNRRAVLISFLDQGLVSLTTIGLSLALIVFGTPEVFGQFTFFLMLVLVAASLQHGLIGIHILVSVRPKSGDDRQRALETLVSCDVLFRIAASALVMIIGLLVTSDPRILASGGLFAFVYLWRETARNILFATERGERALLIDALAFIATAILYAFLLQRQVSALAPLLSAGLAYLMFLFAFGRYLAGSGTLVTGLWPGPVIRRFRSEFNQSGWTLLDSSANEVQMRGYVVVVEAMRGFGQLGVLEAGRVLWGPLVLLVSAWRRVAQPHLAVLLERNDIASARLVALSGVAIALVLSAAYAGVLKLAWPILNLYIFRGGFDAAASFVVGWGVYTLILISNWMLVIFLNAARRFRLVASVVIVSAIASLLLLSVLAFGAQLIMVIYGMIAIQAAVFVVFTALVFLIDVAKVPVMIHQEKPA